jgi:hypothetical protein
VASSKRARSPGWDLILREVRVRRAGIALGVMVGLCWTVGKVSVGILIARAVDRGIEADDMGALRDWALLIALAAVVVGTFTGLRRYVAFREARWIETDLREQLFAHFQRLHFAFHDRAQTGQLIQRGRMRAHRRRPPIPAASRRPSPRQKRVSALQRIGPPSGRGIPRPLQGRILYLLGRPRPPHL